LDEIIIITLHCKLNVLITIVMFLKKCRQFKRESHLMAPEPAAMLRAVTRRYSGDGKACDIS
jgi:hypothetical protein